MIRSQKDIKKFVWLCIAIVLSALLCVVGIVISLKAQLNKINLVVMSTNDGVYQIDNYGGRAEINQEGNIMSLFAEANDGYSFVGYFDESNQKLSTEQSLSLCNYLDKTIFAKFAKNYEINLFFDDINSEDELSEKFTLYVGEQVCVYDLLEEKFGNNFASHYQYSLTKNSISQAALENGFVHSLSSFVVGAENTDIIIKPIDPVLVGWTGDGSALNPYLLGSAFDFQVLNDKLKTGTSFAGIYFKMNDDVNLWCSQASQWEPIGGFNNLTSSLYSFDGIFDGGNHVVKNLYIDNDKNYQGLFGYVSGIVQNLGIISSTVVGKSHVGSVCGYLTGSISNCFSTADVSGSGSSIGGVCGSSSGVISLCYNTGNVSTEIASASNIGGVLGQNLAKGMLQNVFSDATISATPAQIIGGVVGLNNGKIYNSFATGSARGTMYVGGVVGQNAKTGLINNCYSSANIHTSKTYVGGVAGRDVGSIQNSYYLTGCATDGFNRVQNGFGSVQLGGLTEDSDTIFAFDADGKMSTHVVNGIKISTLNMALNVGHETLRIVDDNNYCTWKSGDNFSYIYTGNAWNSFSLINFDGTGAQDNPYLISSQDEFENFVILVNVGQTFSERYLTLSLDIDLEGDEENPTNSIGGKWQNDLYAFDGNFDGGLHTIKGIYIDSENDYQGLFGYCLGNVSNLIVEGVVKGANSVGGVCGYLSGSVSNCFVNVDIFATGECVGGIAGNLEYTTEITIIESCMYSGTINGEADISKYIGGITGFVCENGIVRNSFCVGKINAKAKYQSTGGIAGYNAGKIINTFSQGYVEGKNCVGGVIGTNDGTVVNSYSSGNVVGSSNYCGGVVGLNNAIIENCYYLTGSVIDGGQIPQKGVGIAMIGENSPENPITPAFDAGGIIAPQNVCGYRCASLLNALNVGLDICCSIDSGNYSVWANTVFPTLCNNNVWNDTYVYANFEGYGVQSSPYLISTAKEMWKLSVMVNLGQSLSNTYFKLTDNIDLACSELMPWIAIGSNVNGIITSFDGIFDGDGYTISNIFINNTKSNQGLFGILSGEVLNLNVSDAIIIAQDNVGGIAGNLLGRISNCKIEASLSSLGNNIGGIAGLSSGTIEKSKFEGSLSMTSTAGLCVGGLVGKNLETSIILNSYNVSNILGTNYSNIGGIAGINTGSIINCYSTGNILSGFSNIGGISGTNDGTIINCYNSGSISASSNYVGGITGKNTGKVNKTYYLYGVVKDSNKFVQNGVGSAEIGKAVIDEPSQTIAFQEDLTIISTIVFGQSTTNLIEALNFGVFEERTHGGKLLAWQEENLLPVFTYNLSTWNGTKAEVFAGGSGSIDNPYKISNAAQLKYLSNQVNLGTSYEGLYFILTNDIYLNNKDISGCCELNEWEPIGNSSSVFLGNVDGNNYVVSGLYINASDNYQGLFGYTAGNISNLGIVDGYVYGIENVGAISAFSFGSIHNCYNYCQISASNNVGGIVGVNMGNVYDCNNYGNVQTYGNNIGGICGYNYLTIINSSNKANVTGENYVGGICGYGNSGEIINSKNSGKIVAKAIVGGICGYSASEIKNCVNTGRISASISNAGAICGKNEGQIEDCYYLLATATINNDVQFGVGCTDSFATDVSHETTLFNDQFVLHNVTISGATSDNLVDVLNFWVNNNISLYSIYMKQWQLVSDELEFVQNWYGNSSTEFSGGDGTKLNPYKISSANDLKYLSNQVNSGILFDGKYFEMTNDIYLNDETFVFESDSGLVKVTDGINVVYIGTGIIGDTSGLNNLFDAIPSKMGKLYTYEGASYGNYSGELNTWIPIGSALNSSQSIVYNFGGIFDGCGHSILGVYINNDQLYQGVFGKTSGNAVIKNLNLKNSIIIGNSYIGGIVGSNNGTIVNCCNYSFIGAKEENVGGIAGYITSLGKVQNSYNNGLICTGLRSAGGIVGYSFDGLVENCYNTGKILANSNCCSIVGSWLENGNAINCYYLVNCAYDTFATEVMISELESMEETLNNSLQTDWNVWYISSNGEASFVKEEKKIDDVQNFFAGQGTQNDPYIITNEKELIYFATVAGDYYYRLANDIYLNNESFEFDADSGLIIVTDGINTGYLGTGFVGDNSGMVDTFDEVASIRGVWYTDKSGTVGEYSGNIIEWISVGSIVVGSVDGKPTQNKDCQNVTNGNVFTGNFDGNGYSIYGLFNKGYGMFADIWNGTIKNLSFVDGCILGDSVLANIVYGTTIDSCHSSCVVCGTNASGLIYGTNKGEKVITSYNFGVSYNNINYTNSQITNCYNTSYVIGSQRATGLVQELTYASLKNSYNIGTIVGNIASGVCGNVIGNGLSTTTINSCQNYGLILGKLEAGGLFINISGALDNDIYTENYVTSIETDYETHYYVASRTITKTPQIVSVINCINKGIVNASKAGGVVVEIMLNKAPAVQLKNSGNYTHIKGTNYVAGVCSILTYGSILDCFNYGSVLGEEYIGGICASSSGNFERCYNTGNITGSNYIGGIIAFQNGVDDYSYRIENCVASGNIIGTNYIGGICGCANGASKTIIIKNCYSVCDITGTSSLGGIVGLVYKGVQGVYSTSNISLSNIIGDFYVGGVCGNNQYEKCSFVDSQYAYGNIKATSCLEEYQFAIGVMQGVWPENDIIGQTSSIKQDIIVETTGKTLTYNKEIVFNKFNIYFGGGAYVFDWQNGEYIFDNNVVSLNNYGLSVDGDGTCVFVIYKVGVQVTLYVNGMGVMQDTFGWNTAENGQTATKILFSGYAINDLPIPVQEGYSFIGWYTDESCSKQMVLSSTIYDASFAKLYAKWAVTSYKLIADTNDICQIPETFGWVCEGTKANAVVYYNEPIGQLPELVVDGYVFEGWYQDAEFTNPITRTTVYWQAQDGTIYAKLTPNSLILNINLNDEAWENSNISVALYYVDENFREVKVCEKTGINDSQFYISTNATEVILAGKYKVYASVKSGQTENLAYIGFDIDISGETLADLSYYSLVITKSIGVNLVYVSAENGDSVIGSDLHKSEQIYLKNQKITLTAILAEGKTIVIWNGTMGELPINSTNNNFVLDFVGLTVLNASTT